MSELLHQLGIDGKLLLSQAVNFGIVLIVLRVFLYKPLIKLMKDRRMKIEEGIAKAEEADTRLREADEVMKAKVKKAEEEALMILRATEQDAKRRETELLEEAKKKEAALMEEAEKKARAKEAEAEEALKKEAAGLVRAAIVRTVELSPEAVDNALIVKAIREIADKKTK